MSLLFYNLFKWIQRF